MFHQIADLLFAGGIKTSDTPVTVNENSDATVHFTIDNACQTENSANTTAKVTVQGAHQPREVCRVVYKNRRWLPSPGCTYDKQSRDFTATRRVVGEQGELWVLSVKRKGCETVQHTVHIQVKRKSSVPKTRSRIP